MRRDIGPHLVPLRLQQRGDEAGGGSLAVGADHVDGAVGLLGGSQGLHQLLHAVEAQPGAEPLEAVHVLPDLAAGRTRSLLFLPGQRQSPAHPFLVVPAHLRPAQLPRRPGGRAPQPPPPRAPWPRSPGCPACPGPWRLRRGPCRPCCSSRSASRSTSTRPSRSSRALTPGPSMEAKRPSGCCALAQHRHDLAAGQLPEGLRQPREGRRRRRASISTRVTLPTTSRARPSSSRAERRPATTAMKASMAVSAAGSAHSAVGLRVGRVEDAGRAQSRPAPAAGSCRSPR